MCVPVTDQGQNWVKKWNGAHDVPGHVYPCVVLVLVLVARLRWLGILYPGRFSGFVVVHQINHFGAENSTGWDYRRVLHSNNNKQ